MTGFPRTMFARFPDDVQIVNLSHLPQRMRPSSEQYWVNTSWAGPPIPSHPDLAVAASFRNYVADVIGSRGGYDLFIMVPGTFRSPTWDVLSPGPDSVNEYGLPNRMLVRLGGEEGGVPYDEHSWRWRNFYASNYGATTSRHMGIQQFLWQIKSLHMCHEWVLEHAATENITYRYKVKTRPDIAWLKPIPPLHTLDASFAKRIIYYQPGSRPDSPRDSFAMGLTEHMDPYLSRFKDVFTEPPRLDRPNAKWNAEWFPKELLMTKYNIQFTYHLGLNICFSLRMRDCGHGQGWNCSYSSGREVSLLPAYQ
jgi:hypothetical protein